MSDELISCAQLHTGFLIGSLGFGKIEAELLYTVKPSDTIVLTQSLSAINSNIDSILVLEEPESHTFLYYCTFQVFRSDRYL